MIARAVRASVKERLLVAAPSLGWFGPKGFWPADGTVTPRLVTVDLRTKRATWCLRRTGERPDFLARIALAGTHCHGRGGRANGLQPTTVGYEERSPLEGWL